MSPKEIDRTLRGLPLSDRIGCLIVNLCEQRKDSIAAIGSLIATASILGKNLPDEFDRLQMASALRECATGVEAEHVPMVRN